MPSKGTTTELADLLLPLLKALVLLPNAVRVESGEKESTIFLTLFIDSSDRGRIIGKQGKLLQALRLIFQSVATLKGRNAVIEIKEAESVNSASGS